MSHVAARYMVVTNGPFSLRSGIHDPLPDGPIDDIDQQGGSGRIRLRMVPQLGDDLTSGAQVSASEDVLSRSFPIPKPDGGVIETAEPTVLCFTLWLPQRAYEVRFSIRVGFSGAEESHFGYINQRVGPVGLHVIAPPLTASTPPQPGQVPDLEFSLEPPDEGPRLVYFSDVLLLAHVVPVST